MTTQPKPLEAHWLGTTLRFVGSFGNRPLMVRTSRRVGTYATGHHHAPHAKSFGHPADRGNDVTDAGLKR